MVVPFRSRDLARWFNESDCGKKWWFILAASLVLVMVVGLCIAIIRLSMRVD